MPAAAPPAPGRDLATVAARFGLLLRAGGVAVTPERSIRFAAAVELAGPTAVEEVYWLGRVTLLDSAEQIALYDRTFAQVFRGRTDVADSRGDTAAPPSVAVPPDAGPGPDRTPSRGSDSESGGPVPAPAGAGRAADAEDPEPDSITVTASERERLLGRDFAACTVEELTRIRSLVAQLRLLAPLRDARRAVSHPAGRRLDLRRTLRAAHRTGGDPVRQMRRRRVRRSRRVVLIADVSGSMESYARVYLHLLHGAVRATRAEAFVFATRLTRLTRALAVSNPDLALARAAAAAPDWSGGTRIGLALKVFLDEHGRRGLARGAVVVIVSDGWERGDPAMLGEQIARLSRLAHRVVWVNPRSAAERFEPLVGGMAAALPHVDAFVAGHSVRALDDVLAAIADG